MAERPLEKTLNTRIKLKYDTLAAWTAIQDSFYPLKGEVCCVQITEANINAQELPPVMFKVGTWNGIEGDPSKISFKNLQWASALAADVHAWAKLSITEFEDRYLQITAEPTKDPTDETKEIPSGIKINKIDIKDATDETKVIGHKHHISIDDSITFIFDCGGAPTAAEV